MVRKYQIHFGLRWELLTGGFNSIVATRERVCLSQTSIRSLSTAASNRQGFGENT